MSFNYNIWPLSDESSLYYLECKRELNALLSMNDKTVFPTTLYVNFPLCINEAVHRFANASRDNFLRRQLEYCPLAV